MAVQAAAGAREGPRPRSRTIRRLLENLEAWLFLLPAAAVLGVFHFFPIVYAFFISLLRWNMIDPVRPFVACARVRVEAVERGSRPTRPRREQRSGPP